MFGEEAINIKDSLLTLAADTEDEVVRAMLPNVVSTVHYVLGREKAPVVIIIFSIAIFGSFFRTKTPSDYPI
jgi:hypothetical protein